MQGNPLKATFTPKKWGLIKGLLTIGFLSFFILEGGVGREDSEKKSIEPSYTSGKLTVVFT